MALGINDKEISKDIKLSDTVYKLLDGSVVLRGKCYDELIQTCETFKDFFDHSFDSRGGILFGDRSVDANGSVQGCIH